MKALLARLAGWVLDRIDDTVCRLSRDLGGEDE